MFCPPASLHHEFRSSLVSVGSAIQIFKTFSYQTLHTLALGFTIGELALQPNA